MKAQSLADLVEMAARLDLRPAPAQAPADTSFS